MQIGGNTVVTHLSINALFGYSCSAFSSTLRRSCFDVNLSDISNVGYWRSQSGSAIALGAAILDPISALVAR